MTKMTYYNKYFDNKAGRTYEPLTEYYLPPAYYKYYHLAGYYSPVYRDTYYNGYGYNFYYGDYGYYQDSINSKAGRLKVMITIAITSIGFMSIYWKKSYSKISFSKLLQV